MAESWKDYRNFKDEPISMITQVQNRKNTSLTKGSINDLDQISKVETCSDKIAEHLDQIEIQQNCMNLYLSLKETQTDSLLEDEKESEVDRDNSNNSLVKIDDFSIKIETIPNLLEVKIKNN